MMTVLPPQEDRGTLYIGLMLVALLWTAALALAY